MVIKGAFVSVIWVDYTNNVFLWACYVQEEMDLGVIIVCGSETFLLLILLNPDTPVLLVETSRLWWVFMGWI